jgi:hypothetical protein
MENIYDPWNLSNNININIPGEYLFLGPRKLDSNNKIYHRHKILTKIIIKNNEDIEISSIERGESGYKIFEIILKHNFNAHIENISKTKFYSGSDIMIFVLQILYRLNVKSCSLKDSSYYICERNNFFKLTEIPLKILKLLQKNNTFYSYFGFNPVDKSNKKNKLNDIRNLVGNLYNITWNELEEIISSGKEQINISNTSGKNIEYNSFLIRNITKWKKYWIAIYNSWKKFRNKYESISASPFRAFIHLEEKNCIDFVGWLELYSYTFNNFNKVIYYNFIGKRYDIPYIKTFNQLKETINNVDWINKSIVPQQDIFKQ